MSVKSHAKFAASSSERWVQCPGSVGASENVFKEDSAAAHEGVLAHELMEFALNTGVKNVVKFWENEEDKYPLEMRQHVETFVAWVRSKLKRGFELVVEERVQLDEVFFGPKECKCLCLCDVEKKDCKECCDCKKAFGTVDVAIIEPFGCLEITDFKYGKKKVNHVGNSQMNYYALGLAHKLKYDIDCVKNTIYQPRAAVRKHPARTHTFHPDQLFVWRDKFKAAIANAESENPTFKSGEWCFFCPAKPTCATYAKKFEQRAADTFGEYKD